MFTIASTVSTFSLSIASVFVKQWLTSLKMSVFVYKGSEYPHRSVDLGFNFSGTLQCREYIELFDPPSPQTLRHKYFSSLVTYTYSLNSAVKHRGH